MLSIRSEFIRFVIVGGVNTLHYYLIYMFFLHVLGIHYFTAHIIGFISSLIGSFFLNTLYTYKVKPTWGAFIRFPLTQLFNTITTAALLFLLVEQLHMNSSIAPMVAVVFTIPATFILTGRVLKTSCKKKIISYPTYLK
jgi:putative flippase GtrA